MFPGLLVLPESRDLISQHALKEDEEEPLQGKTIASLISSDYDYIVYLDRESYVYWDMNDNVLIDKYGEAITRVAILESVQIGDQSNVETFRRLVGEGVARLCEQNPAAASLSFDKAEEWIRARNQERARLWYLAAASLVTLPLALALLGMILWSPYIRSVSALRAPVFEVIVGGCAGAIGAFLSVIRRARQTELDISAGRRLHQIEGAARIIVGTLGAALFAVGIQADLVLGFVQTQYKFATLLVFCIVAGISERLVPSFVEQVESTGGYSAPRSSNTSDRNVPSSEAPDGPVRHRRTQDDESSRAVMD